MRDLSLKDIAEILSNLAVFLGVLITWWYAGSWYKQYLYGRRDKAFGDLQSMLKTAIFATEDLCSLMHSRDYVEVFAKVIGSMQRENIDPVKLTERMHSLFDEDSKFLDMLMKTHKECMNAWIDFQLAASVALPFVSRSSRILFAETSEHIGLLHDTFMAAIARFGGNGPYEAAEALKQLWLPKMGTYVTRLQLMLQEESCRGPKLRSHTKEIIKELKSSDRYPL